MRSKSSPIGGKRKATPRKLPCNWVERQTKGNSAEKGNRRRAPLKSCCHNKRHDSFTHLPIQSVRQLHWFRVRLCLCENFHLPEKFSGNGSEKSGKTQPSLLSPSAHFDLSICRLIIQSVLLVRFLSLIFSTISFDNKGGSDWLLFATIFITIFIFSRPVVWAFHFLFSRRKLVYLDVIYSA